MPAAAPEKNGEIVVELAKKRFEPLSSQHIVFDLSNAARYRLHHVCYEGMHFLIFV